MVFSISDWDGVGMKRLIWIMILFCYIALWACCDERWDDEQSSLDNAEVIALPQDQTVIERQTATFLVAVNSSEPLRYQWLRDGTDIPGATRYRYDTPQVNLADNGTQFSVRVSNSSASMRTNPARLTVIAESDLPEPLETAVDPAATDPAISSDFGSHFAEMNPAVSPKDKLFLFFPGTGAQPKGYLLIIRAAANNGYHAVGLAYPNARTVGHLCSGTNIECPGNLHEESLTGQDAAAEIDVSPADSIENRLIKLLSYLDDRHPGDGWEQFLGSKGTIAWDAIRVAGHSQGGATAGYISKKFGVDRAVFFSSPYDLVGNETAAWVLSAGATDTERYFGFSHLQDSVVPWNAIERNWTALGMDQFGGAVDVDSNRPPYKGSHMLSTNLISTSNLLPYHNITAADFNTPLDAGGLPTYRHIWQYLCFLN